MDIFTYFLHNYRLYDDTGHISIGYGIREKSDIQIVKSVGDDFWNEKLGVSSQNIVWKKWNGVEIPFLFENDDTAEIITIENGCIYINYDIVASTFYFLSGWDEITNPGKDEYGRIAYEQSIIKTLGIAHIPVVNYYFDILHYATSQFPKKNQKSKIKNQKWNDHSFAVALTHDIDNCMTAWIEGSFSELKRGRLFSIPGLVLKRFISSDDWFNFDLISSIEKQYNARSTFFFLPEKGKTNQWKNADYDVCHQKIRNTIRKLEDDGFEIGVHGSFGTHGDMQKLKKEISKINATSIIGSRFHFLMFDPEKTTGILENSGIKYDSSLGFAEHIGFRRGTCYPFFLFDFAQNKISAVLEIPLIVMDTTLRNKKYMGFTPEQTRDKIFKLVDEVKKFNGVFTLLWHNTFFSDYKFTGWKQIYLNILEYCNNNNALMTTNRNIYEKITGK